MGPYLDVLASRLLELGYCHSQARKLVRTAAALGVWLAERGLTPADAGKAELAQYLATQRRTPKGRVTDGTVGFSRLPALLASEGVLCKPPAPVPGEAWLDRFEKYWTTVRGTTPSTNTQYRRPLGSFVAGLCRDNEPDWSLLNPEYVTDFVVNKTAVVRAEKHRIVIAVRAFLHFLAPKVSFHVRSYARSRESGVGDKRLFQSACLLNRWMPSFRPAVPSNMARCETVHSLRFWPVSASAQAN